MVGVNWFCFGCSGKDMCGVFRINMFLFSIFEYVKVFIYVVIIDGMIV